MLAAAMMAVGASELFVGGTAPFPDCVQNMTCFKLTHPKRRDLVYDCASFNTSSAPSKGNVYFMHGNDGPRSKGMYALMMQSAGAHGYSTLACDQRGFSPGASPMNQSEYAYDLLVQDIFDITDTYFGAGARFHVVGHDQGARVAWHALAGRTARSRFISYTSLSIPHLDAFSEMMYGDDPEEEQQLHYAYVRQLTLPNSVTAYENNVWIHVCSNALHYATKEACQPAMWWYNGAYTSGAIALQPWAGFGPIGKSVGIPESYIKANSPYPLEGLPQKQPIGVVSELPIQYICGPGEVADLCNDRAQQGTAKFVTNFTFLKVAGCGHALCDPSRCKNFQQVIDAVVTHIEAAARNSGY